MNIIGLTGASGAGKSTVAAAFSSEGIAHIDGDAGARAVVEPGSSCLAELAYNFGDDILREDGSLNRGELARRVFSNSEQLEQLNAIIHPYILEWMDQKAAALIAGGAKAVCVDAAALIESGYADRCRFLCVVTAPRNLRLRRIMERDHLDEEQAALRLDGQKEDAFYIAHADYVLRNDGDLEALQQQAIVLAKTMLEKMR